MDAWVTDPLPTESHKVLTAALAVEMAQAAIAAMQGAGLQRHDLPSPAAWARPR
jgi:hypothetical protein